VEPQVHQLRVDVRRIVFGPENDGALVERLHY
jgi:hypothetical protein